MRINYKGNDYELTELCEPNANETFDIIAIFRIKYCIWKGSNLVEVSKDVFEQTLDNFEKMEFVNYFYGADDDIEEIAKEYIDNEEEQKKKELKECCEKYDYDYDFALNVAISAYMEEGYSLIDAYDECIEEIKFQSKE